MTSAIDKPQPRRNPVVLLRIAPNGLKAVGLLTTSCAVQGSSRANPKRRLRTINERRKMESSTGAPNVWNWVLPTARIHCAVVVLIRKPIAHREVTITPTSKDLGTRGANDQLRYRKARMDR